MADRGLTRQGDVFVLNLGGDENRLDRAFVDEVNRLLDDVERSTGPAALVTMGEGKFFSNGFDLNWLGELDQEELRGYLAEVQQLLARILAFPLPTVAALNGHAFGAGALVALAHDDRIMRRDRGYFCFPEIDLGLPFQPGMMALIQCRLTPVICRDALLRGTRFGAVEALERGIVDEAVLLEDLRPRAIEHAATLTSKDRAALRALKLTMYRGPFVLLNGRPAAK